MAAKKKVTPRKAQKPWRNTTRDDGVKTPPRTPKLIDLSPTAPLNDHHRLAVLDELEQFRANDEPPWTTMLVAVQNYREMINGRIAARVKAASK
jgi:hypothetical protein